MSHKAEVDVCGCLSTVIVSILPIVLLWDIKVRATKMERETTGEYMNITRD